MRHFDTLSKASINDKGYNLSRLDRSLKKSSQEKFEDKVIQIIRSDSGRKWTYIDISKRTNESKKKASKALSNLFKQSKVERNNDAKPYEYFAPRNKQDLSIEKENLLKRLEDLKALVESIENQIKNG
jgi:predicted transcriptional regulator